MKWPLIVAALGLAACQSAQEKNAIFLKDRVEKLQPLSNWKPIRCDVHSQLSAPQEKLYRAAFPQELPLLDDWNVTYDWTARRSTCEVHAQPLTPMTANQRAFVEEAFCTLMQVFWVHSPFDDLRILPTDVIDEDEMVFLRQKADSEIGLYLDKKEMRIETRTARNGTYSARYVQHGSIWLPSELRHQTTGFTFILKDFQWSDDHARTPPKSFWIYVGELQATPAAHSGIQIGECKAL